MIDKLKDAITHCKEVAKEKRIEEQEWRDKRDFIESNERNPKGIYDLPINQCKECASEHEQLAEWLTELAERREADRWIPVSERLPDKNGKCLVSLDFGDVCLDFYDKDWGFVCYVGNVIAWKPLPKPYESEAEVNERIRSL